MAGRSWFFASNGQQQGPYPEAQFRDLIARGAVAPDTLVWTEGMAGWQPAGDVPGLMSAGMARAVVPPGGGPVTESGGYGAGSALSLDFGILDFTWRSLVFLFGVVFVIPAPWVIVWYVNWFVSCVRVPGRPNLSFTGKPLTIAPWFFGAIILIVLISVIANRTDNQVISQLGTLIQFVLYWLFLRYLIANLASNGRPLGLSFSGSVWAFLGWTLLTLIAFITIIGWAWVYAAQMRWICRNIQGTRREVVFNGTGLQILWRTFVLAIVSSLIIPIPWMYRWMLRWQASQTELVARGAYAA